MAWFLENYLSQRHLLILYDICSFNLVLDVDVDDYCILREVAVINDNHMNAISMDCFVCLIIDINECSSSSHGCDANAVCNNVQGSYNCACKAGYSGDGKNCTGE